MSQLDARLGGELAQEIDREGHGAPWVRALLQDVRFGLRMLRVGSAAVGQAST
jgi:hypothetical protein